jgi:thiol-disulfide isomerase/thioredoxin
MLKARLLMLLTLVCAAAGLLQVEGTATKSHLGETLPEFNVEFVGEKPELKNRPLILEFWATWCPPCRQSIPHLNEVYDKYRSQGLEIIGVTDEDAATLGSFVKDNPIKYHPALDQGGKLAKHFGIRGIPHAMLVDKSGKIVWEGSPLTMKDADVEALLKK